jgi:hypothetical protein
MRSKHNGARTSATGERTRQVATTVTDKTQAGCLYRKDNKHKHNHSHGPAQMIKTALIKANAI